MQVSATQPDEYLAAIEDDSVRDAMRVLDEVIAGAMPERRRALYEGTFWGGTEQRIIGYGRMTQSRPRGETVEWFIVGLARQKANYSLYVNAVASGAYLGHRYGAKLGKVKLGAASIGFRRLEDVDLETLRDMAAEAHAMIPPDSS